MANIITGIRPLCALALIFCAPYSGQFYAFYLIGCLSDVLDGLVARLTHTETKLGSSLDTAADIIFLASVLIKMIGAVYLPPWITVWIIAIAVVKVSGIVIGFIRHRRFIAVHTVLNKVCGLLLFLIPLCIGHFPTQPVALLVILSCVTATAAAIQEFLLILSGKSVG